jgi:hypothetical protein
MTKPVKLHFTPPKSQILIGDIDIADVVTAMHFSSTARDRKLKITLEVITTEVELAGETVVVVAPVTHQALVALGWAPPAE